MKKLSDRALVTIRNVVSILGVGIGFVLWCFLPTTFKNTAYFHVGNGESGVKYGALILLLIQLFAFIPNSAEEAHSDDPEEKARIEAENSRKNHELQACTAIGLALTIWIIMGTAVMIL